MANTMFLGQKTALGANSNKYGYSLKGFCVKRDDGNYYTADGVNVGRQVSTDVAHIVKVAKTIGDIHKGAIVLIDAIPFKVYDKSIVDEDTSKLELFNLMSGSVVTLVLEDSKLCNVFYDTFEVPSMAIQAVDEIKLNEFTSAQLYDLKKGKTTVEALRAPQGSELEAKIARIVTNLLSLDSGKAENAEQPNA